MATTLITAPDSPTKASIYPPVSAIPAAAPGSGHPFSLVLANDGDGWLGTYGIVLSALLCDLVPEGALDASITFLTEDEKEDNRAGYVTAFDPATMEITMADGTVIDGHEVLAIGI